MKSQYIFATRECKTAIDLWVRRCLKSVRTRIQFKCGKIEMRKTPKVDTSQNMQEYGFSLTCILPYSHIFYTVLVLVRDIGFWWWKENSKKVHSLLHTYSIHTGHRFLHPYIGLSLNIPLKLRGLPVFISSNLDQLISDLLRNYRIFQNYMHITFRYLKNEKCKAFTYCAQILSMK